MPYLSVAKRGYVSQFDLVEVVNAILYKLKSGCQWRMLPMGHMFTGEPPSFITIFKHYRKWCGKGDWETAFSQNVKDNKEKIDLSISHIDGSHTPAYKVAKSLNIRVERNVPRQMSSILWTDRGCHWPCLSLRAATTPTF